jgi:sulfur carrier protein
MRVHVNGEPIDVDGALSLAGLLQQLGLDRRRIAVEHNKAVVRHRDFSRTRLADGDAVEIVRLVGEG